MEGLEVTDLRLSEVLDENESFRIDNQFFQKEFLINDFAGKANLNLKDVCLIRSGTTPIDRDATLKDGVVLLKTTDIRNNVLTQGDSDSFFYINNATDEVMRNTRLQAEDVLINIVGATTQVIGRSAIVTNDFPKANITQAMALLRITNQRLNPYFLFSFLCGRFANKQVRRIARPTGQYNLNLVELGGFKVPIVSDSLQLQIESLVKTAHQTIETNKTIYAQAERTLLSELGFLHWQPPEPLTYERKASEAFATGRLDSEYFSPKYESLEAFLTQRFIVERIRQWGKVLKGSSVEYTDDIDGVPVIRSGDLTDIEDDQKFLRAYPGQDMFLLKPGDVLISSIGFGSIGKVQVFDKQGKYATVSEVTVIRQKRVNPYFLHFYLRSLAGQMQINRHITGATGQLHLYPKDVETILVPLVSEELEQQLEGLFKNARRLKAEAKRLLEAAKRAVEIAIEESEAAAIEFLEAESLKE